MVIYHSNVMEQHDSEMVLTAGMVRIIVDFKLISMNKKASRSKLACSKWFE